MYGGFSSLAGFPGGVFNFLPGVQGPAASVLSGEKRSRSFYTECIVPNPQGSDCLFHLFRGGGAVSSLTEWGRGGYPGAQLLAKELPRLVILFLPAIPSYRCNWCYSF